MRLQHTSVQWKWGKVTEHDLLAFQKCWYALQQQSRGTAAVLQLFGCYMSPRSKCSAEFQLARLDFPSAPSAWTYSTGMGLFPLMRPVHQIKHMIWNQGSDLVRQCLLWWILVCSNAERFLPENCWGFPTYKKLGAHNLWACRTISLSM